MRGVQKEELREGKRLPRRSERGLDRQREENPRGH
jgi:hypothetical protein